MNKSSLNYEDLRDSVELEIFGIKFGINDSKEYIERLNKKKYELQNNQITDEEEIRKLINVFLDDEDAYKKISEKYKQDLGKEISDYVWLQIYQYIMNQVNAYKNMNEYNIKKTRTNYNNYRRNYRNNYRR